MSEERAATPVSKPVVNATLTGGSWILLLLTFFFSCNAASDAGHAASRAGDAKSAADSARHQVRELHSKIDQLERSVAALERTVRTECGAAPAAAPAEPTP